MKKISTVDEYINKQKLSTGILQKLRAIALHHDELEETIKWGIPCYTLKGKNVLGIAVFKSFTSIWFYQGAELNDPADVLVNAQEGKTKSLRQWRFNNESAFAAELVSKYVSEAIHVMKKGQIDVKSTETPIEIPPLLQASINNETGVKKGFELLTAYKQKEYCEYITGAKRENTQLNRLKKILPMIKSGVGLNDKYRK
jgi:uncharacterized protein YdeI (YjbR/CyaY-like superfamily)